MRQRLAIWFLYIHVCWQGDYCISTSYLLVQDSSFTAKYIRSFRRDVRIFTIYQSVHLQCCHDGKDNSISLPHLPPLPQRSPAVYEHIACICCNDVMYCFISTSHAPHAPPTPLFPTPAANQTTLPRSPCRFPPFRVTYIAHILPSFTYCSPSTSSSVIRPCFCSVISKPLNPLLGDIWTCKRCESYLQKPREKY